MCLPVSVCQAQFSCAALQLPQHGCTKLLAFICLASFSETNMPMACLAHHMLSSS